ncbi:fluoride efflux transporter FluC [Actinokineospora inagensis]|uniref:fluoride efflux transporter FluC n=1 Tax=Actinokineospora inagensis TaxID=103730 RepID=UPI00042163D4|nr:CrcB family protein [Actinokineospora inagensis]
MAVRQTSAAVITVAVGGVIGALARYGAGTLWPGPWTTLGINAVGCLTMGVLMVLVTEVRIPHPLVRLFLGTGVLGGFTTFSTFCADFCRLVPTAPLEAFSYLIATLTAALAGVSLGMFTTRRLAGLR